MKFLQCLILILISFATLADGKGNYFKDRNVYLACIFAPLERGGVTSYHHFWNGRFTTLRRGDIDKHYSFAIMNMTSKNLVLKDTSTKLNSVFYEWGMESDETSGCKRKSRIEEITIFEEAEVLSESADCPSGETIFNSPYLPYWDYDEDVWYTGDNEEIIRISLGPSDTTTLSKSNRKNLLEISRISLKPTNVPISSPCMKISKELFIERKKDFYKKREEDSKRIKDDFAL